MEHAEESSRAKESRKHRAQPSKRGLTLLRNSSQGSAAAYRQRQSREAVPAQERYDSVCRPPHLHRALKAWVT